MAQNEENKCRNFQKNWRVELDKGDTELLR